MQLAETQTLTNKSLTSPTITGTGSIAGTFTGDVTGNVSGTAATVTGAAQTAITSVGTLTALDVDNIEIDGNTISSVAGTDLNITPLAGQQIVLDGTVIVDAGVVTGATSITSTAFVGDLTGNVTGTAATVTGAAQTAITSVGTLTALQVDNININGNTITSSTAADMVMNVTDGQSVVIEGLDIDDGVVTGASSITSTAFVGDVTGDVVAGTLDVNGISTLGSTTGSTVSAAGIVNVNNTTDATNGTDGSLQTDGGLSVAKSAYFGSDIEVNGIIVGRGTGGHSENTAVGSEALGTGVGQRNTAVGRLALRSYSGTSFDNNTAVGYNNSSQVSTGQQNTSMGAEALMNVTTASANTAIGAHSLINATGSSNTALGYAAGQVIVAGNNNTFLGKSANGSSATLNNATAIGYGATVAADNTIQLGNTSTTNVNTSGAVTGGSLTDGTATLTGGVMSGITGITLTGANLDSDDLTFSTVGSDGDIVLDSDDTVLLDADGVFEINSSAGAISIGNDAVAQAINIGTGAAARTIQVGNAASAAVNVDALAVDLTSVNAMSLSDGTASLVFDGSGATSITATTTTFTGNVKGPKSTGDDEFVTYFQLDSLGNKAPFHKSISAKKVDYVGSVAGDHQNLTSSTVGVGDQQMILHDNGSIAVIQYIESAEAANDNNAFAVQNESAGLNRGSILKIRDAGYYHVEIMIELNSTTFDTYLRGQLVKSDASAVESVITTGAVVVHGADFSESGYLQLSGIVECTAGDNALLINLFAKSIAGTPTVYVKSFNVTLSRVGEY